MNSLRVATIVLTMGGLFNFYAFYTVAFPMFNNRRPIPLIDLVELTGGLVGIGFIAFACWFLLLPLFEFLGRRIRVVIAPNVDRPQWEDARYRSLKPAAKLAGPGLILWLIWVFVFYYLKVDFYVISYAVGVAAHILAACLYVPLVVRWFRLWRGSRGRVDSEVTS